MRAMWYDAVGGALDVLQIGELPQPNPAAGEVRVRVAYSTANPSDTLRRSGATGPIAYPRIVPHSDGAGVIDSVGAGVPQSRIGERVWIYNAQWLRPAGTAAEFVVVPHNQAVPLPEQASMETGATLGIPGCTAHRCVFGGGPVSGMVLLVAGGAGVVGRYAIQLAKWGNARVVATVTSSADISAASEAGADHVVNLAEEDAQRAIAAVIGGRGIDRVVEVEFGGNLSLNLSLLASNGSIAAYYSGQVPEPKLPFGALLRKGANLNFVFVYTIPLAARAAAIADLTHCLRQGVLRPRIAKKYNLEQGAMSHDDLDNRRLKGSALLEISEVQ